MINTENYKTKTVGNGGVTYPYDFKIWDESQIRVVRSNKVSPLEKDEGVLHTDFTVDSVGASAGGNITCIGDWASDPPGSDEYVTCIRDLDYKQPVDIESQGVPKGNTIEKLVDVLTALVLQIKEVTDRCIKVDEVSDEDPDGLTYESFAGSAPMDDSGWSGLLSGVSPVTVQGALDQVDSDGAPLASPVFTGSPVAPTQAIYDDSTKLATTEYVDRASNILIMEDTGLDVDKDAWGPAGAFSEWEFRTADSFSVSASCQVRLQLLNALGNPVVGAYYDSCVVGMDSNGNAIDYQAHNQTYMLLALPTQAAGGVFNVKLWMTHDAPESQITGLVSWVNTGGYVVTAHFAGYIHGTSEGRGGLRISVTSGTLLGAWQLWGRAKGS